MYQLWFWTGRGREETRVLRGSLRGLGGVPFRVPKRGHGPGFNVVNTGTSVARVRKCSGLRTTSNDVGRVRGSFTGLCSTGHSFLLMGNSAINLLDTVFTTTSSKSGVVVTEGYRGDICSTYLLERLGIICTRPGFSRVRKVCARLRRTRTSELVGLRPSTGTVILAIPACRKVADYVATGVPVVTSNTRTTRFPFKSFPGCPDTSVIVSDLRGALPTLARATITGVCGRGFAREFGFFVSVLRADSPDCLLVTSTSQYYRCLRGSGHSFTRCSTLLSGFCSGAGLHGLSFVPGSSGDEVYISATGYGVDNSRLTRTLQGGFNVRPRTTCLRRIVLVSAITSARGGLSTLSATLARVSLLLAPTGPGSLRGPPYSNGVRGVALPGRFRTATLRGYVKGVYTRFVCTCPPSVPLVAPGSRVATSFLGLVERFGTTKARLIDSSKLLVSGYVLAGRSWWCGVCGGV